MVFLSPIEVQNTACYIFRPHDGFLGSVCYRWGVLFLVGGVCVGLVFVVVAVLVVWGWDLCARLFCPLLARGTHTDSVRGGGGVRGVRGRVAGCGRVWGGRGGVRATGCVGGVGFVGGGLFGHVGRLGGGGEGGGGSGWGGGGGGVFWVDWG